MMLLNMIPKLKTLTPIFLILAISSFIFLYNLGSRSLANWDEAWYANASQFMYRHDHFLTPVWNGQYFFDKPPLQYWLTQPFFHLFGEQELSYRLPSAIASIGLTVLVFIWGKKRFGAMGGLAASVILLSFPHFIDRGRSGNFDGLFIFLTTLSLYLFTNKKTILGGIFLGLAWMTKGVFSGFFPIVAIGIFAIYEIIRDKKLSLFISLIIFTVSASVVYFPWYFIEIHRFNDLITKSYFATLDQGTFGNISWMDIAWRFDLRYLVFLWTFLRFWFPVFLISIIIKLLQFNKQFFLSSKCYCEEPRHGGATWQSIHQLFNNFLPFTVFLVVFLALSATREKNDWYIMPVYPFAAILIVEFITSLIKSITKKFNLSSPSPSLSLFSISICLAISISNLYIYRHQSFPLDNHLPEKQVAQLVKTLTSSDDLIVTAEYEYPALIYYSERQVRTATRQPNYEGKYWWIWDNIDIQRALEKGQSIITIHRPGTEWSIDVYGWHRQTIAELNGRIISRLIPN